MRKDDMLKLTSRYYQAIPLDTPGYQFQSVELDPVRTVLVVLHCWNIGCPEGPPIDVNYFVGMGSLESFREADRMMREAIRPSMDAARKAGVLVAHVEHENIWRKHPSCVEDADPPADPNAYWPGEAVPGWRTHIANRSHGKDYATKSGYAMMDRAKIVEPLAGEPVVYQTNQLDRVLRRRTIENLIYTGFCTDMCILRAPGGIEPMAGFGYRFYLMRDATVGCEFPDTIQAKVATHGAIRYYETHYGDTVTSEEFIQACEKL